MGALLEYAKFLKDRASDDAAKKAVEIAEELGISQAQVSRIESGAINTLKKILR